MITLIAGSRRALQEINLFQIRNVPGILRYICPSILMTFALLLAPGLATGQEPSQPTPPANIGGFNYSYVPEQGIHMNICGHARCIPGSKVSYIFYAPNPAPVFEDFQRAQEQLRSDLQDHLPEGSTVIMGEPEIQESSATYSAFSNTREERSEVGNRLFVRSNLVVTKKFVLSLISSSRDKEMAKTNEALFLISIIMSGQVN